MCGDAGPSGYAPLSNTEYDNTVQDLLRVTGTAAIFLPEDQALGYRNIAAALLVPTAVAGQHS